MQGGKNFLGKNLQNFAGSGNLYDFTYHKLTRMLAQMLKWDPTHPDVLVLNNILELYVDGDVSTSTGLKAIFGLSSQYLKTLKTNSMKRIWDCWKTNFSSSLCFFRPLCWVTQTFSIFDSVKGF